MRTEAETARLGAHLFSAQANLAACEQRAAKFDENCHLRQWEIGGEKWSLADLDRRVEGLNDEARLFGRYVLHLSPQAREQASREIERLSAIREEIVGSIRQQQRDLREQSRDAGQLLGLLSDAYYRAQESRADSALSMPAPRFTGKELERIADHIETARDAGLLRQLHEYERQFPAYADPKEIVPLERQFRRALGREVMAEVFHRESVERLLSFQLRAEVQPLLLETPEGHLLTERLKGTEPRSLAERVLRPLIETSPERAKRDAVHAALWQVQERLVADAEKAIGYRSAAREIIENLRGERDRGAGTSATLPPLELTAKQEANLEIYAEGLSDPNARAHYLGIVRGEIADRLTTVATPPDRSQSPMRSPAPETGVARNEPARAGGRGR